MDLTPLYEVVSDADDGAGVVTLHVQVSPGAGKSTVVGRHGDALKLRVAAPPAGGRANDAARALLAETFALKERNVELVAGETSRTKRFRLSSLDLEDFQRRLQLLVAPREKPRPTSSG